ncbi:hypothetical protein KPL71_026444 [Citrus sinensis]|uniref:Uncharacterized protein n=1 Tax=Citrus sinensis TaxID=2711 RepID=A0ACB8HZH5_CITSI|nr:hypothetical protein KPL71_026444 [Citrus sinensis]
MPLEWLTNYEQFHQNSEPVQTSQAVFERRPDGQVKLSFQTPDKPSPESPRLSYTAMITAVSTEQESNLPIYGFSSEGHPVYPEKVNDHFLWDVPEAHMCNPDCPCLDETNDYKEFEIMRQRRRRKKKPSTPKTPCWPYSSGLPDDPESYQPLPIYKKALRQLQRESSFKPPSLFTKTQSIPIPAPLFTSYQLFYTPSKYTSTPIVEESFDDNNDDQGSQIEPAPSVPPVPEKSSKPSSSPWFTFDDIPCHKWQARHQEFAAWIDFIGETTASRKEYHQMKCCSLKRHHLEMHYKRMSMLYYKLNGFNDPSLKHVFAASLPPELQPELQRQLTAFNLDIANVSLGKIFQLTMLCLDKICEQKYFFKDLIEHKEPFASACKKPYLKIQCKDDKNCTWPTTKKKHFQKHFHKSSSKKPKKPYRYFRKKDPSQFRKKKYNRCFICKKRGHFAHNCPNKSAKVVRLIQHLQQSSILFDNEDVESIFSEQLEKDDHTAFILADSTDSYPDDISVISTIQEINHIRPTLTGPSVKISVIPSKFHKHVSVIGFLNTGAQRNVLRLYTLSDTAPPYTSISQKFLALCPDNHSQFTHPSPLWKNTQFFIHLPFKLNEDVNPTKATHPGMPPSDLTLAKQE